MSKKSFFLCDEPVITNEETFYGVNINMIREFAFIPGTKTEKPRIECLFLEGTRTVIDGIDALKLLNAMKVKPRLNEDDVARLFCALDKIEDEQAIATAQGGQPWTKIDWIAERAEAIERGKPFPCPRHSGCYNQAGEHINDSTQCENFEACVEKRVALDQPDLSESFPCPLGTASWMTGEERCEDSQQCKNFKECTDEAVAIDLGRGRDDPDEDDWRSEIL